MGQIPPLPWWFGDLCYHRRGTLDVGPEGQPEPQCQKNVMEFIDSMDIIDVDLAVALEFGKRRGALLDAGTPMPDIDALLAATALHFNLTLVTHNTSDFSAVPNLRLADWMQL